jgi:hypothetical protein
LTYLPHNLVADIRGAEDPAARCSARARDSLSASFIKTLSVYKASLPALRIH